MNIEQQISTKKKSSFFQKIIFSLAFISILSFIGIITYTVTTDKKGAHYLKALFLFSEIVCYFFVIISVIYYIISYFKQLVNTNILKKSLFSIDTNQQILSNIFNEKKMN